jgi:outer membrane protein TolC
MRTAGAGTIVLFLLCGSATAEPLSVEQAVQRAVENNVTLAIQHLDLELARDAKTRAWSAFEPRLGGGLSQSSDLVNYSDPDDPVTGVPVRIGVSQALPGGGTVVVSYAGTIYGEKGQELGYDSTPDLVVNLVQPLLSGAIFGARERAIEEAEFGIDVGRLLLEGAVADLILAVEAGYWSLVQSDDAVAAAHQSLEGAQRQRTWVEERITLGFDPPSEILSTQERIASAEAEVAASGASRENAEAELLYLLGVDLTAAQRPSVEPSSVPGDSPSPSTERALEAARSGSIAMRTARLQLEQSRRGLRYSVADQLPSLDGAVSMRRDLGQEDASTWWTFGLSLSMPLPGVGRIAGIRSAQRRVRQAEMRFDDAKQQLQLAVERAVRDVDTSRERFVLAERGLDLAQRKYDAEVERLSRGTSTNREVLEYLEDRDTAARTWNQSRTAVARSRGRLRRVTGASLNDWDIALDRLTEAAGR